MDSDVANELCHQEHTHSLSRQSGAQTEDVQKLHTHVWFASWYASTSSYALISYMHMVRQVHHHDAWGHLSPLPSIDPKDFGTAWLVLSYRTSFYGYLCQNWHWNVLFLCSYRPLIKVAKMKCQEAWKLNFCLAGQKCEAAFPSSDLSSVGATGRFWYKYFVHSVQRRNCAWKAINEA